MFIYWKEGNDKLFFFSSTTPFLYLKDIKEKIITTKNQIQIEYYMAKQSKFFVVKMNSFLYFFILLKKETFLFICYWKNHLFDSITNKQKIHLIRHLGITKRKYFYFHIERNILLRVHMLTGDRSAFVTKKEAHDHTVPLSYTFYYNKKNRYKKINCTGGRWSSSFSIITIIMIRTEQFNYHDRMTCSEWMKFYR